MARLFLLIAIVAVFIPLFSNSYTEAGFLSELGNSLQGLPVAGNGVDELLHYLDKMLGELFSELFNDSTPMVSSASSSESK